MTALCAHLLVERGQLDVDAPVARYWPEFAQAGKGTLPVRYLLSHTAGLAAIREPLAADAFYDWRRMVDALAAETPWWEPGSASGYHALTYGYLVGEVVRRISGKTLGTFFRDEVAGPLGADFHIGLAATEDERVAEMIPPTPEETAAAGTAAAVDPESLLGKVMRNPALTPEIANTRAWRAAEIPAANGHGNARSVARVLAALACGGTLDGVRLLGENNAGARHRRAVLREGPGPRLPDPLGPRLHDDEPGPAARPQPAHVRPRRLGRLARLRRPRRARQLGVRDEQDVARHHRRHPRRRPVDGIVRSTVAPLVNAQSS